MPPIGTMVASDHSLNFARSRRGTPSWSAITVSGRGTASSETTSKRTVPASLATRSWAIARIEALSFMTRAGENALLTSFL